LTPDPHFLFASKQHARAKAYMESTIWLADGFVVVTGEIGSGKTTLIESFLAELPEDVILAQINQTQLSPVEFLQTLLVEFGFKPFRKKKVELLSNLKDYMIEQYAAGKTLLLVIDEAQNLSRRVLEEVRMLSGIESQKEKLLRIILAGQPELAYKLDSPRLEQLNQRVRLRFHLGALSKRETREYIEHRLEVAGAKGRRLFEDDAHDVVFRYSGGIPRLTNILCDTAMLCAFAEEKNVITADLVRAAAEELQWTPYANRKPLNGSPFEDTGEFQRGSAQLASFEVLFHDQVITDFPLMPGRAIIGRTADNDLQIRSKFVSRHHAQIITTRENCVVEDLNSTNGIFVRSQRVKHHELSEGDIVQLGEHELLYHDLRGRGGEEARKRDEELDDDDLLDEEDDDESE
jgi:type II secretory pathway predicted ATPase ExeA